MNNVRPNGSNEPSPSNPPRKRPRPTQDSPLDFPATILIDSREQTPYPFTGLVADAKDGGRPLHVPTQVVGLPTGDYSLAWYEGNVAVERKSLADLYHTIGQDRDRFVRELERLNAFAVAAVVVEASWDTILRFPPSHTRLRPKTVFRSVLAWQQRYPAVHWWCVEGRRLGEVVTFRILERYWRTVQTGKSEAES